MKSEVKKVDASTMEIILSVEGDVVRNKFEDVFKKIGQQAKIKGFRAGHTPRDILEKEYSGLAHEQVVQELVAELYGQAVEKEGLHVLDTPQITDVKLDRASLSFKARVEITPEIDIKQYKGIAVNYKKVSVSADEVKRSIDSIKESRKIEAVDEPFAKVLGYPSVAELEKAIERQLAVQKDNVQRRDVEQQLIDGLTKNVEVKLPQSLVSKHLEELMRQTKMELAMRGVPKETIIEQEPAMRKELEEQARQQVKTYLVLAEVAKREKIPAGEAMSRSVMELLFKEAQWNITEDKA